jgi:hypothetical protein
MRTFIFVVIPLSVFLMGCNKNKYVGVRACKSCHQTEEEGEQYKIWLNSRQAGAFNTLSTMEAQEIAKKKGLRKPAAESQECLECHTITEEVKVKKDGVQCESCHGPGSVYKSNANMEDRTKAIAAGLTYYKDEAAIENKCRSCHNEKSPTYRPFNFSVMWGDIKHPIPKNNQTE